jgi:hypothetical protein
MIYLSDLKDQYREEYEKDIRKKRPDLVAALDAGETIVIADNIDSKDYYAA